MTEMIHTENGLTLGYKETRIQVCDSCLVDGKKFTTGKKVIPYWVDIEGKDQVKQPEELTNLT
jgi:hypothetical protein